MAKKSIEKEYRLLFRVPKSSIIDFLLQKNEQAVKAALDKLKLPASGSLLSTLKKHHYRNVISVFEKCSETTKVDARYLFDQYRYRGMKSLNLYTCDNLNSLGQLKKNALADIVSTRANVYHLDQPQRFSNFKIRDIEELRAGVFVEIYYSYNAPVQILSPETEYPQLVSDLRGGFIWLNKQHLWMCICAKDESINCILAESLQEHLQFKARRLPLTKTVQQRVENDKYIRKAGFLYPVTGTRRRITNPHMASDPVAMKEFRERDRREDRPLSAFNKTLDDGTDFALNYNRKGKIYFSRDFTVSQMREWGPKQIQTIVEIVKAFGLNDPATLLNDSMEALKGIPKENRKAVLEIASSVIRCKRDNISDVPLTSTVFELASKLTTKVEPIFRTHCRECDDITEIYCPSCKKRVFSMGDHRVVCKSCAASVKRTVTCIEGHSIIISDASDLVQLLPLSTLCEIIRNVLSEARAPSLTQEEYFYIRGNELFFASPASKTALSIEELPEANSLLSQPIPATLAKQIHESLPTFNEKQCSHPTIGDCSNCLRNRKNPRCFIRLFGLFDPDYPPGPHEGHEFGDYSKHVTINGIAQQVLVVAMKRYRATKRISHRSSLGKDIYSQVMGYIHDGTIDIVGICVPGKLNERFQAMLLHDARNWQKKLLFVDDTDLVKIIYSAMTRNRLQLQDI